MFRIALLSRWHVHSHKNDQRYVKEFLSQPDCKVTCVWDKDEAIAKEWAEEYGVPYETELEAVLSRDDVDGVLVTSNATEHREIFIAAANHKKHIFTEKVLAYTLEDAYAIKEAIERNGIKFCISFNRLAIKQLAYAKALVDNGTLGTPVQFRCMCGHAQGITNELPEYWYDPKVTGGGAMIDLGFNSAYLARYIMGEMESVSSSFSYDTIHKKVEDHASCNVRFKSGAMGVIEATFVSPLMSVFELAVYGTKGAYYARFGGNATAELRLLGEPNKVLSLDEIPNSLKSPVLTWIDACVKGGSDKDYGIDAAIDMVKYMLAAYESDKQDGKRVKI
jgi:predicted dehydrogenase